MPATPLAAVRLLDVPLRVRLRRRALRGTPLPAHDTTPLHGQTADAGVRVGIDTYSYHRFFGEIREGEEDPLTRWTIWDFLDRAVELGVDGVSLETCHLDLDDPAFRERLALTLDEAGLEAVLAWGPSRGSGDG